MRQTNKFKRKINNTLAGATFAATGVFAYALVCPVVNESAAAVDSKVTASVDAIISISAPETVALSLTPTASGSVFTSGSASVKVTTNSAYGYSLSMGTSGSSTALTNSSNSSVTIPTLSSNTTYSTFSSTSDTTTTNKWGFTTNNNGTDTDSGQITANTYLPLTSSSDSTLIKKTDTTASADTTTVTFGVKVNKSQLSGSYTNTVVFSAVANPKVYKMQEMTPTLCASLDEEVTYQFTDSRDGNVYNIARLKDGNCWMQQNLRLGSDSAMTLSPDNTDITSEWTLPASVSSGSWSYSTTTPEFYAASSSDSGWEESYGYYYNWTAAVAMDDSSDLIDNGTEAAGSICPKGWKLPYNDGSYSNDTNQFYKLLNTYGINFDSGDTADTDKLQAEPLSFAFSGYYLGGLYDLGVSGYWWSRTVYDGSNAYGLGAYSDGSVYPVLYDFRVLGYSVRCVAAE